jgi:hypothetical protein
MLGTYALHEFLTPDEISDLITLYNRDDTKFKFVQDASKALDPLMPRITELTKTDLSATQLAYGILAVMMSKDTKLSAKNQLRANYLQTLFFN